MKLPFLPCSYRHIGVPLLLLIAGALAFGVTVAQADDGKQYPGSFCVRWSGGTPTYSWSRIGNTHTSSALRVDCPVVKDTIYGDINDGTVRVIDQHFTQSVSCNLVSFYVTDTGGLAAWASGNKETVGSSPEPKELLFGSIGANSRSHYFYSCQIPPRYEGETSWLINYRVDED